jgi:GxxExxY protein
MNTISGKIVDAALHVHKVLGPGLLESVYVVLAHELQQRGLHVRRQHPVPIEYGEIRLQIGFRADLLVEDLIIVEVKSVVAVAPVHKMQLLTYLRLADKKLGLLINFNVPLIKDGICRVVNGLDDHAETQRTQSKRR